MSKLIVSDQVEDWKNKLPLSYMQKMLWAKVEYEPEGNSSYNNIKVVHITGDLNSFYLKQAWAQVLENYPILRMQIKKAGNQVYLEVLDDLSFGIKDIDFSSYKEKTAWQKSRELIDENLKKPYDLMQAPLFRIFYLRISKYNNVLACCFHQMLVDRISVEIVARQIISRYNSLKNGILPDSKGPELGYLNFLGWQQEHIFNKSVKLNNEFWKNQFSILPENLNLPYDYKRLSPSRIFSSYNLPFENEFDLKLEKTSKITQFSPLIIYAAALYIILKKYTGQTDICFSIPFSGRVREEFENVIGLFEVQLPIRLSVEEDICVMDVLKEADKAINQAIENQYCLLEETTGSETGNVNRNLLPFNQVSLYFDIEEDEEVTFDGCNCKELTEYSACTKYDLSFAFKKSSGRFTGQLFYDTSLFSSDTIVRMAKYFVSVLNSILQNPEIKTAKIVMLSNEELATIEQWNKTEVDYPVFESVPTLFSQQVERTPDSVAIIQKDLRITYCELCKRMENLCNLFIDYKVSVGQKIIVCMERSVESITCILAILKTGAIYVPLDPKYPVERVLFIINDCNADLILTNSDYKELLSSSGKNILIIDKNTIVGEKRYERETPKITPDSPIYVMYTSGSTGVPKGIVGKNRGLINRLFWIWNTYPYAKDEVCCHKISIGFIDHLAEIFSPLLKGIPVVVFNREVVSGVEDFCNVVIDQKISRLIMTPSSLKLMMKEKREVGLMFKNIRFVFCSGEALPFSLADDFYTEFSSARLINIYGSSEVSADVTYYEVNKFSIKDVLHYFSRFSLNKEELNRHKNELGHFSEFITKPDVDLCDVSRMFNNYRLYESPLKIEQYYKMLYSDVLPFIINTASPKFIGHMTSALPDYLHDLSKLISQLNQNMVKIETSKSLTFLEREALAILHHCFYSYSDDFYEDNIQKVNANLGIITTGGTTSNIGALLSARNKILFEDSENVSSFHESIYSIMHKKGYKDMVVIGSPLMHYSMKKASSILGLGINNIIYVKMTDDNRIDIADLEKTIIKCKEERILILAIVGIAGATETGIIDPLDDIASIAQRYGVHFHVDAAWGGALIFSEKYKNLLKGIRGADTITLCGHKQLFLPQGISICLFKDPCHLNYAATAARYQAEPNTYDFGRFTIEGSRSALSLCLHASLRILGKRGYEVLIDDGIEKAKLFSQIITASSAFELIEKPQINILNYRYIPEKFRSGQKKGKISAEDRKFINTVNEMIQQKQFLNGNTFVSKTVLTRKENGVEESITVFRAVLSNPLTTYDDLYSVLEDQLKIAEILFGERNDYGRGVINRKLSNNKENAICDESLTIPIGKPIFNTKVYILDSLNNIVPIGIPGEICIAGEPVAYGYLNNDEQNSNRFINNPFDRAPYDMLYCTGDLGKYLPDGAIKFLGRIDDQIKIRGIRVECGEIESVLCSDPDIIDAAVVGVKNAKGVELICFYVSLQNVQISNTRLKKILASKIPQYMIPSTFIEQKSFPVLPNGKIDKKRLKYIAECLVIKNYSRFEEVNLSDE